MISTILAATLAATVITEKAPDGVNTVTKTVDDNGYVISESQTLVHVPQRYNPSTQVYRLERNTETEELYLVGQDMVKRRVCILDPEEYAVLTGQVAQVWQSMHKTEDGRVKLHGRRKEQVIEGSEKTTYYEDGYRFTEKMEVRRTHTSDNVVRTNGVRSAIMPTRKPTNISDRQWKMRQMIEARKKSKGKTVTVEHNAATGKDTVK